MSYDAELVDPVTGEVLELDEPHQMKGGTYAVGGTKRAYLNITYNYAPYYKTLSSKGLRGLDEKTGAESIPILQTTALRLKDDINEDYWKATEGNAKRALYQLIALAKLRPDGVWRIS